MSLIKIILLSLIALFACEAVMSQGENSKTKVAIAIHGGAGTILKENMSPELEQAYKDKMEEALNAGYQLLQQGKSSVEAVRAAIRVMEDSELFNAGKGAVFTHHKTNELDASIMEGSGLNAGAIAGVTQIKNPIELAYKVMVNSKHVMLSGVRAEEFAKSQNVEMVPPEYFHTERRWNQLMKILKTDPDALKLSEDKDDKLSQVTVWPDDEKFGTVGAVALDANGTLAAGTSTGGMTNKKYGRIGDSPIIGAGTYADNQACAISATGHGEYFIRAVVAHDICARVLYKGISLQQAADEVINQKLVEMKGEGGIVGMDPMGTPVFSFNSKGMYRGYIDVNGKVFLGIYQD